MFVGLGLGKGGISLRGLEESRSADKVYAEFYTSLLPDLDLEEKIGSPIEVLDRAGVEQDPEEILDAAKGGKVVFLVPGDPMVATTHVDLRLRAEEAGVETAIIHGASIETAAPGLAGLQSYKFGRSVTLPLPEKPSDTPYEVLEDNLESGLHTLFLLDIEEEEDRYLTADGAIECLLDLEGRLGRGAFSEDTLCVVVARAGTSDSLVRVGRAGDLAGTDFGEPPHVLIIPGDLHFLEAEALERLGGASEKEIEGNVEG